LQEIVRQKKFTIMIDLHLGKAERAPTSVKLLLPPVAAMFIWTAVHPLLTQQGLIPRAHSEGQILRQAALLGLSSMLVWKLLVIGILALHVINSYLYLGRIPFWQFVSTTAKNLLRPLSSVRLRIGKIDLAPLAGITIVIVVGELTARCLPNIYQRL
jgi:uncharacterized protein YggT (Ycf19 family)